MKMLLAAALFFFLCLIPASASSEATFGSEIWAFMIYPPLGGECRPFLCRRLCLRALASCSSSSRRVRGTGAGAGCVDSKVSCSAADSFLSSLLLVLDGGFFARLDGLRVG